MKSFQITVLSERETPDREGSLRSLRLHFVETVKGSSYRLAENGYLSIMSEGLPIATYAPNYWCSISEAAS